VQVEDGTLLLRFQRAGRKEGPMVVKRDGEQLVNRRGIAHGRSNCVTYRKQESGFANPDVAGGSADGRFVHVTSLVRGTTSTLGRWWWYMVTL